MNEEGSRLDRAHDTWKRSETEEERDNLEAAKRVDDVYITYIRQLKELVTEQESIIKDTEATLKQRNRDIDGLEGDSQHYKELLSMAESDARAQQDEVPETAYEDALNGFHQAHKERRKLQD